MDARRPYSYIVAGFGIALIIIGSVIAVNARNHSPDERTDFTGTGETQEPVDTREPSQLTGVKVKKDLASQPIIGVMISNSKDARPQSGLADAGIVFEAIAEGGITRQLALFQEKSPEFLGPVRSLRPYFIDFARGFNATVGHVGGSKEALTAAKSELAGRDLDQFSIGTAAFERVGFRYAPHNVYTNVNTLRSLAESNGHSSNKFTPLKRQNPEPAAVPTATDISINYSSASYNTFWKYNKDNNRYLRTLGGEPHLDRETKKQLEFDTVVVIKSEYGSFFRDGTTYSTVKSTGNGTAYVFQNGKAQRVTWKRSKVTDQFAFTSTDGQPVALNSGQTWFAMQPTSQGLNFE